MAKLFVNKNGYPAYANSGMPVHRAVAQNKIGRSLRPDEDVHHNNGDKTDFRKENLSVMSHSFHSKIHAAKRRGFW